MLRVRLLGGLALELDGDPIEAPASRPARALLSWLALHPGRHPRGELAARFWPDVLDSSARASLRTALHALRAALGDDGAQRLLATRDDVALAGDVWVDTREFEDLISAGRPVEALALREGELLAGFDDDWVYEAREAFQEALLTLLEQLASEADAAGDSAAAVRWTREQTQLDPLSEERNRALMERLAEAGDRAAALAVYERLRDKLRLDLRIAPSAQTRALVERLRHEEPEAPSATATAGEPLALPAAVSRRRRSTFVGRERELERLRAAYAAAGCGERRFVAVAGEPGIGKTRLVSEFCRAAYARGAAVLFGRCAEEPLVPYQPFVEALRPYGAQVPADLIGNAGGEDDAPVRGARWRLFEAVDALFGAEDREEPTVLVLDDLHWADRPTLALLAHLVRSPEPAPLLVVGTHRSSELPRTHPLATTLSDLRREELAERIDVFGLALTDVGLLMHEWVGDGAPAALHRALHDETEGNPFFVEELLRHYAEAGEARGEDVMGARVMAGAGGRVAELGGRVAELGGPVPESVKEVIAQRVARLGDGAIRVLSAAAVAGREFGLELLEALDELAGEEPLASLEAAMAARMVREEPGVPGRYGFAHALFRETLYEDLSAARRARLHRSIAAALERLHGADAREHLGELAHHHLAAGDGEQAVAAAVAAARAADTQLAYEEAASWYERALAVLSPEESPARACELLLALGHARQRAGEGPPARDAFGEAAEIARTLGDGELLARAALGFSGLGVTIITVDADTEMLLHEALDAVGHEGALAARLLARIAIETYYDSLPQERKALGDRAVELARAAGDETALIDALNARHVALWSAAYLDERLHTATEIIELAERSGDLERAIQGYNWLVLDHAERGDIAAMQRAIDRHEQLADALALPSYQWWAPMWRSTIAILQGRLDEAERLVEEVACIGRRARDQNAALYVEIQTHGFVIEREDYGTLDERMLECQTGGPAEAAYRAGYSWLFAGQGDDERARELVDWVVDDDFALLPEDMNRLAALCELAQATTLLGYAAPAAAIYEQLAPYGDRNVINGRAAVGYGSASLHLGDLAVLAGDGERAAAHYEDALEHNERMGARCWLARTQLRYGELLRARGDAVRAGALLDRAEAIATELGLEALGARVRARRGASAGQAAAP